MPKILFKWCLKWTPAALASPELMSPLLGKSATLSSIVRPHDRSQSASSIFLSQMRACNPSQTSKTQLRTFVGNYPSKRSASLRKETTQRTAIPRIESVGSYFHSDPAVPEAATIWDLPFLWSKCILFLPRLGLSLATRISTVPKLTNHLRHQSFETRPVLNTKSSKES